MRRNRLRPVVPGLTTRRLMSQVTPEEATMQDHHEFCVPVYHTEHVSTCLTINVGHRADGSLLTVVRFASGERLEAEAGNPDLGVGEAHEVVHDAAHTILACLLGLDRSPVLERVVDLAPLSQRDVDLEEAATFALQAWCASLRNEDPAGFIANIRTALDRLEVSA